MKFNRELIARMEAKIAATLARIWGEMVKEGEPPVVTVPPATETSAKITR